MEVVDWEQLVNVGADRLMTFGTEWLLKLLIIGPCETVKFVIVKVCCRVEICHLGADSLSSVTITCTLALDVEAMAQFVCVQSVEFIMCEGGFLFFPFDDFCLSF